MSNHMTNANETLRVLSEGDLSVLNVLMRMQEGSLEESGLDPETFMLARIAALATLDAAPASWLVNLRNYRHTHCDRAGNRDGSYRLSGREYRRGPWTPGE